MCGENGRRNVLVYMFTFDLGIPVNVYTCPYCDRIRQKV